MIYALLTRNTSAQVRRQIAQAIEERSADVLRQYSQSGIIRHIMDIDPRDRYYCIYCGDRLQGSRGNAPRGEMAGNPWYFRHSENRECIGREHNISNGIYINPKHHGCYVQLGCVGYPPNSCNLRRDSDTSYCHYAYTRICRP